ncbi:MAG TPA: beta-1,6-N-acetylglucosaminyltransferase [Chitinophagaceae bacterium]
MKIAYLIAAHNNYLHLQRLIAALNEKHSAFYVHIDKKYALPDIKGDNIVFIEKRVNVHWSGFSQVRATLNLLDRAMKDENDYFAFLSGVDYPIKCNSYLYDKLKEGGEYIHIQKMGTDPYAPLSRYKYYYFTDYYNRRDKRSGKTQFFLGVQKKLRKLRIRKKIPFQLYTGASWFILSKFCVRYILDEIKKDKKYIQFFRFGFCPDESFFQTIIGNSKFCKNVRGYLTYADWSIDPGPAIIEPYHIPVLKTLTGKFFARKFNDNSAAIIELIDQELRSAEEKIVE